MGAFLRLYVISLRVHVSADASLLHLTTAVPMHRRPSHVERSVERRVDLLPRPYRCAPLRKASGLGSLTLKRLIALLAGLHRGRIGSPRNGCVRAQIRITPIAAPGRMRGVESSTPPPIAMSIRARH